MKNSKQLGLEQQIIELQVSESEMIQQECQEQLSEEESEMLDQLLPQPVFQIEEDHQHLTQEQKDAFYYIKAVRDQKKQLLKDISKHKPKHQIKYESITQNNVKLQEFDPIMTKKNLQKISFWQSQCISNWKLIIDNLKYLSKNIVKEQLFKQKLTVEALKQKPQAYKLCYNKSLNLFQIEKLIVQFSNHYYQSILYPNNQQNKSIKSDNYYLWVYSLLALHQSYAYYTNFEALASINAVISLESDILRKNSDKSVNKEHLISYLLLTTIMIDVFRQQFLKKYLVLLHDQIFE